MPAPKDAGQTIMATSFLIAENGVSAGQRNELTKEQYILGRHPECDIVVEAGAVSRHHARLFRLNRDYFVEDMKSRNGTYVNDQLIFGQRQLKNGDHIRVCDISFVFESSVPALSKDSHIPVLIDDDARESTIMSKLDLSSEEGGGVQFRATSEAKLKALVEITKSLGRSLSLDQVLPQVLNSLFKVFLQADRGFIVLCGPDGQLIPKWSKLRREDSTESPRISRTIIKEVVNLQQAILSADASNDERFEMSESIADFRIRSMMCAPLINADGEVLGVLQIDTVDQRNRFRQEDLEVLASVAIQAAVAIDNAKLHDSLLEQRTLESELELAREVQHGFLPERRPESRHFEFFDYYEPASQIGGDYYDYVPLPNDRLAVLVADVVGHGAPAALLMARLSASVRFSFASVNDPAEAMRQLNRTLSRDEFDGRFITAAVVILDPSSEIITLVNAGHMPPIVRRADGTVLEIGAGVTGMPLMIDTDAEYESHDDTLKPGDVMVMFTDGINEAMSADGELYGFERLKKCLNQPHADIVGQSVIADVQHFIVNRPASDDMCLVCTGRRD